MNKRPADTDITDNKVSRRKVIFTTDPIKADRYQLMTKVETKDKHIIYTSWSIFKGIEYFEKLLDSSMKESQSREISLMYLNLKPAKDYLDLISSEYQEDFVWEYIYLLDLYDQLDYHQLLALRDECKNRITSGVYSIRLYEWNKIRQMISLESMAEKLYDRMKKRVNCVSIPVPSDNDQLLIKFLQLCSSDATTEHLVIWSVLKQIPYDMMVKYIDHYNSIPVNISKVICILMSTEIDINLIPHRDLFIKHISSAVYHFECSKGLHDKS